MWFVQLSTECVCDHLEVKSSPVFKGDCLLTCRILAWLRTCRGFCGLR